MLLAPDMICELAECVEIRRVVECETFIKCKALAVFDFECDSAEIRVE
jgi:hypothetical protein